ncbi:MAG TPA: Lrp/AsnC ligand binding domain-containing protein [Thiolinea sp.]|nr:Lrp/AsnC ligand binding domain-containing protein [Thiolinea sp.]
MPERGNMKKYRRINLLRYRDEHCNGETRLLAEKLRTTPGNLNKHLGTSNPRPISDKQARKYEAFLGFRTGDLDRPAERQNHIYYVMINVQSRHVLTVLKWMKKFSAVREASATYGNCDIVARLEVDEPRFLGIVLGEIGSYPGVLRTETLPCITHLHWQRGSLGDITHDLGIREIPPLIENFADEYISKRMQYHFNEIESLGKGEAESHDRRTHDIDRVGMLKSARKRIFAIRLKDDVTLGNDRYFEAEKECINTGVRSRRIIVLESDWINRFAVLQKQYHALEGIRCEVRFIHCSDWVQSDNIMDPTDFLIIDDEFVYVREHSKSRISKNREEVKNFKDLFMSNWRAALSFEKLQAQKERAGKP